MGSDLVRTKKCKFWASSIRVCTFALVLVEGVLFQVLYCISMKDL